MKNRKVVLAALLAAAMLASTGIVGPAAAECRARTSASSGISLTAGGTGLTERACARARSKWSEIVKQTYGARFASWSAARQRLQAVKREGGFIKCGVQATPCEPTVRAPRR